MRRVREVVTALSLFGVASCAAQGGACPRDAGHVAVLGGKGEHCFRVEVADTPEEWRRGLMSARHLDQDRGMLFVFDRVAGQNFWMRDTWISLDILFIGPDGRIAGIAARTEPLSEAVISSRLPIAAALEINGGLAEKLGLKAGDAVRHPALPEGGPP